MGVTSTIFDDVRAQIAPSYETLTAARERRDKVLGIATDYPGALRIYRSGSIAHGTANSDTDADCGVVLDRRYYPKLGPDGDGVGPADIIEGVRAHVREGLKETHPEVAFRISKRAIRVTYNEPLGDGTDPTVDLVVGLTRAAGALWIPNTERPGWDPSDPEQHTALLTVGPGALRTTRARVIRLAKAWNKQYSTPGLSSFNIEALALVCVTASMGVADGVAELFAYSANDLRKRLTPDPAGVSKPIKLLIERDVVIGRLDKAATLIADALEHDDDEDAVREALAELYWKYVSPPEGSSSKVAYVAALRTGNTGVGIAGGLVLGETAKASLKTTRSYGDGKT